MAAIFGVRLDAYYLDHPTPHLSCVNTKRKDTPIDGGDYGGATAKRKKRRRYNNRDDDDISSGSVAKKKN